MLINNLLIGILTQKKHTVPKYIFGYFQHLGFSICKQVLRSIYNDNL